MTNRKMRLYGHKEGNNAVDYQTIFNVNQTEDMMKNTILWFLGITLLMVSYISTPDIAIGQSTSQQKKTDLTYLQKKEILWNSNPVLNIELRNSSLEEALIAIAKQAKAGLYYDAEMLPDQTVSLDSEGKPLGVVLSELLKDTQLEAYTSGRNIILRERETVDNSADDIGMVDNSIMQETVRGTVVDAQTGEALPGVNLLVQGTTIGVATDEDGVFELTVPTLNETLVVSYIGFQTQTIDLQGRSEINIEMVSEAISGDELIVIGYGTQRRRDLTGSVSSISLEDNDQVQVSSVEQILQGQVAGVHVTTNSSSPGGGISVRIRGTGSITSGSEPLYVIDGIPVYNGTENIPGTGGNEVAPNPMAAINPQDIESIQVLKDASATAIYGARGANGVVLINTREGRSGEAQVRFSSALSTQQPAKTYDVLNAAQYVELVNEVAENWGQARFWPNEPSTYGEGTDWQDLIYETGLKQSYQLSIQGGDDNTRYMVSGNYLNNDGVMVNSGFKRHSARFNFGQDVTDNFRFRVNNTVSSASYALNEEGRATYSSGAALAAASMLPVLEPFTEDGAYTDQTVAVTYGVFPVENPVALVRERDDDTTVNRYIGNAELEYNLLSNLTLQVSLGVDIEELSRERYQTRRLVRMTRNGSANTWERSRRNLLNENLIRYNANLGEMHTLDVTAAFTWQNEEIKFHSLQNADFVSDLTRNDDIGAGSQPGGPNISSGRQEWTLLSSLGRINYSYDGKYLLTFSARMDGSSRFGPDNKWGLFPSGAFAWQVSQEPFMQDLSAIDLKARISYGFSGNQEIGTYSSLARLASRSYTFGDGTNYIGYIPVSVANPELRWETSQQLNVGLDLGFFDRRLRFTADYYNKITDDLILPVTLPYSSGFTSAIQNTGSIRNTGIELALEADVVAGSFSWRTNVTFAANNNEVTDLGDSDRFFGPSTVPGENEGTLIEEGRPLGMFWGYKTDGIIKTEQELEELGYGELGGVRIIDQNGDGAITPGDYTIIGSPFPDFVYGWTNRFFYRGFELSATVQGVYGNEVWNQNLNSLESNDYGLNSTVRRFEGRWTPDNREDATFPKAGWDQNEYTRYDFLVEDGSYLRLQNMTLSYNLPVSGISWLQGLGGARIYIQGQNLFTITNYSGLNPDVNTFGQGTINNGYDNSAYPLMRTYTLGIDLTF